MTATRAQLKWQLSEAEREIRRLKSELDRERQQNERRMKRKVDKQPKTDAWRDWL